MSCGIYKIESPNKKVYIGQSVNIEDRWAQYSRKGKSQVKLYRSLKKYGIENHIFSIIETCSADLLNERERYWQEFYQCVENGLNLVYQSTSEKRKIISDEVKAKISNSLIGFKHSEESKKKIIIGLTGRPVSMETRRKISETQKGKYVPAEVGRKVSQKLKGRKLSEEAITKRKKTLREKNPFKRRVILDFKTGIFYGTVKEASECSGIHRNTLNNYLIGYRPNKSSLFYV